MDLTAALTDHLSPDVRILAAWLFGSRARGTERPDSDVDVGLLLAGTGEMDLCLDLEAALTRALGLRVQVVALNRAPADLVRRVLRDGRLLVDRDPRARLAFEVRKRNEYFDMQPIWRQVRRLGAGVAP